MSEIDQLSDDPAIARQQLEDLAGPLATILVDSFEGGQLPNKSQIRSIRISRDQFAAESHSAGGIRIEIVTQPGQGNIRGQVRTNFYTSRMDGSHPLVDRAPPSRNLNGGMNLSGGLLKDRMSFNLNWSGNNSYTSPVQIASGSSNTATCAADQDRQHVGKLQRRHRLGGHDEPDGPVQRQPLQLRHPQRRSGRV